MIHSDFKTGLEFRFRDQTWRVTDVGARTINAICLTEVWTTRIAANTGKKEHVKLQTIDAKRFVGPPYGVPEIVFDERAFATCLPLEDWENARRVLGLSASREPVKGAKR